MVKYNLTFETNNGFFFSFNKPNYSLEIDVVKEEREVEEDGEIRIKFKNHQIKLPWEEGTKIWHVSFRGWKKSGSIKERLIHRNGEEPEIMKVEIKGIKVEECQVIDGEFDENEKRLRIPASACQSIEFTKGGEKFSYNITAEEAKEIHLLRLDELKEEADILYNNIINTNETAEFSEETIGKWFKRVEEIKFESGSIALQLKEAEKPAGIRKSAEIKKIFESRPFRDKREYFLDKAENFYIEKIEKLERTDEQINNIDFIKGHYDDWRDYIREQNTINGIMKGVKNNLLPKVQAIPLVADRAETELVEEKVRKEVEVDPKVKKSLQTPVSDNNEATNISENQASEPSTSTDIANTKNHADDNLVPQKEPLPTENIPQAPETDLDEYENLWGLIKNANQIEELDSKELKDENIGRLKSRKGGDFSEWKTQNQNLKHIRDLKKELLTQGFTDEELTSELQKVENLRPGPENDWYHLFKNQGSDKIRTKNQVWKIIKELAETKAWTKFFAEKGITDPAHQEKWKQTGLSPTSDRPEILPQTERAWAKGWQDLTDPNISLENSHSGEIEYFYEEKIRGETEKSSLRIKLFQVSYSDVEIFLDLINRINNVNNPADIETAKEKLNEIENPHVKIRMNGVIGNKIKEIWERFFNLHPEINTPLKKGAWIRSGLNPIENSLGEADSEANTAWDNDWTDLTLTDDGKNISIAPSDGVGKIEIIDDEKVKYISYEYDYTFDSLHELLTGCRKDDIDKHFFWEKFKEHYETWWNIRKIVGNSLVDNDKNWDKAEKWRKKGYQPFDASGYQENGWEPEEAAAKNDLSHSGQAKYEGNWYDMTEKKPDIKKNLVIENNQTQSKVDTAPQHTVELREQSGEAKTSQSAPGEEIEVEEGDTTLHTADLREPEVITVVTEITSGGGDETEEVELPTTTTGTETGEESSETLPTYAPYKIVNENKGAVESGSTPSSRATIADNQDETPTISREIQEANLNYLKTHINNLKNEAIEDKNKRCHLINLLRENDQNWGNHWQLWYDYENTPIEKWIAINIRDENLRLEAWNFLAEAKRETLEKIKKNWLKGEIERIKVKIINDAKGVYITIDSENSWKTNWKGEEYTILQFIEEVIQNENDKEQLKVIFEATRKEVMEEIGKNRHGERDADQPSSEKRNWGEIATRGVIVVVVAGAIGVGVWKWLSNRRKPKISKYN
jgi:hypothetical protein